MELLLKLLHPASATTRQPVLLRPTLVDQLLTDGGGKKTVRSGWYAGGQSQTSCWPRLDLNPVRSRWSPSHDEADLRIPVGNRSVDGTSLPPGLVVIRVTG